MALSTKVKATQRALNEGRRGCLIRVSCLKTVKDWAPTYAAGAQLLFMPNALLGSEGVGSVPSSGPDQLPGLAIEAGRQRRVEHALLRREHSFPLRESPDSLSASESSPSSRSTPFGVSLAALLPAENVPNGFVPYFCVVSRWKFQTGPFNVRLKALGRRLHRRCSTDR